MDRKLGQTQRSSKSKLSHHAGDLFALGAKATSTTPKDSLIINLNDNSGTSGPAGSKQRTVASSGSSSGSSSSTSKLASKRESTSSASGSLLQSAPQAKKPKLSNIVVASSGRANISTTGLQQSAVAVGGAAASLQPVIEPWEQHAVDIEPPDLVPTVLYAVDNDQIDTMISAVCGAIRTLKSPRWKFDAVLYYGLSYLCKMRPKIYANTIVTNALCSLLKRDTNTNIKNRLNVFVPVLAANLLYKAHREKREWPVSFVKCYIEDALNERLWVDHEDCRLFVANVLTAFGTVQPAQHLLQSESQSSSLEAATAGLIKTHSTTADVVNLQMISDDDSSDHALLTTASASTTSSSSKQDSASGIDSKIIQRYSSNSSMESIEAYLIEILKESMSKRATPTDLVTRNTLKLMCTTCGLVEVRLLAVSRLELWLHNAKLMKPAQELLAYLCYNFGTKSHKDIEVITQYVKIRLKTKPLNNVYLTCLKAILKENDSIDIMSPLMKHTIYNELSNARNPNNISMVVLMFQEQPEKAPVVLADIYKEYLLNREDCLRQLRLFLRELVRALRYDINLYLFCFTLVSKDRNFNSLVESFEFKDRILSSISDLLCLCMLLGISPQVKEAASCCSRGDKKDLNVLQSYQLQVSRIQFEAIRWMEKIVPWLYKPSNADYLSQMRKILFLENNYEPYVKVDTWPAESERGFFFKLVGEVRVHQNTLIRLCRIGQQKSCPMAARDSLELCEQLVKRSGDVSSQDYLPLLHFDKIEIIDYVFRLTQYHYPDNITLPYGYKPPTLAIAVPYWKAWGIVLILAAHNPVSIGMVCWEQYPMLRSLMEMCITNQFVYPPPTALHSQGGALELTQLETDMERTEKLEIIELETHLAAATTQIKITEETSLLVNQLIRYDPQGPARRPPPAILDALSNLNKTHNLGHLFCRSREPDFLMDIIQRQGTSQSMPWLAELVESSESVGLLPVQCLCEFLLSSEGPNQEKHLQLLQHLQNLVTNAESSPQTACEVLDYFLRRLASPQKLSRTQAIKGLRLLLSCVAIDTDAVRMTNGTWLLDQLPLLPHFEHIKMQVISALRAACQIDMIPENIVYYLRFLAIHTVTNTEEELTELVMDLAQLVVERILIMNSIMMSTETLLYKEALNSLLNIYCSYLQRVKIPRNDSSCYNVADTQETTCLIKWPTGEECFMCMNVIHAMIMLLTYNPVENNHTRLLLDTWFPENPHDTPKGYLYDTTNELKETTLFPDWLMLRMVHSPVQRLVDAALRCVKPAQLLVFIQSFGYPLESISKCLKVLDDWAVMADSNSADEITENDRPYIAMCVAVQHMRGVSDGKIFLRTCNVREEKYPVVMKGKLQDIDVKSYIIDMPAYGKHRVPPKTLQCILDEMLFEHDYAAVNTIRNADHNSELLRRLAVEQKYKTLSSNTVLYGVLKYFKNMDPNRLLSLFVVKSPMLLSLLHMLLSYSSENVKELLFAIFHKAIIKTNVLFDMVPATEILYRLLQNTILKENSVDKKKNGVGMMSSQNLTGKTLESVPLEQLERFIKDLVLNKANAGQKHNVELVDCLCSLLLSDDFTFAVENQDGVGSDTENSSNNFEIQIRQSQRNGMLIDWFASIEPNMVNARSKLQMDLLFSRQADTKGFRPYLLTLLTHQTGWSTLSYCVQYLLSEMRSDYDPSAVLDFLMTLVSNPKLWQGRDKFVPKHDTSEDVLGLGVHNILTVLDYILAEGVQCCQTSSKSTENAANLAADREEVIKRIDQRLLILLHCMRNDQNIVKIIVQYLYMQLSKHTQVELSRRRVIAQFLIQLYTVMPVIVLYQPGLYAVVNNTDLKHSVTRCRLDAMCQSIFTALSSTPALKDWHRKSQDLELSARKVAAVHPNLVLRHLSMIAGSLQGRAHLEFVQFRQRYHLALFTHVIGILELLSPMLFRREHQSDLEDLITLYFNVFQRHLKHIKDLTSLLVRFLNLLQNYINYCPKRALGYIRVHSNALQDLHITLPHMHNLKNIAMGVSMLYQNQNGGRTQNRHGINSATYDANNANNKRSDNNETNSNKNDDMCLEMGMVTMNILPSQPDPYPQQFPSLINALSKTQNGENEIMQALQDLDHVTNKKPHFLGRAVTALCRLINYSAGNVRSLAHALLLRHLKYNPRPISSTDVCYTALMTALNSNDPDVRSSALDRVQDYIICMQEHGLVLLQTLFRLGVRSKANTMPFISKCVTALKLQDGN